VYKGDQTSWIIQEWIGGIRVDLFSTPQVFLNFKLILSSSSSLISA